MVSADREIVIVGAGISGLTAAWRLRQAGIDVGVIEGGKGVGGYAQTERRAGFLLEKGPFNVLVRDASFEALLDDFAGEVQVVAADKVAGNRFVHRRGELHRVPTNPLALLTTPLLSVGGRLRLLGGLFLSKAADKSEQTIEQAASRRLGGEAADTLVSAAISGIYAGDISKLSLNACFPKVAEIDAAARSLIGYGVRAAVRRKKGGSRRSRKWRGMVNCDGGLGALTSAMGARLGERLMTECRVEELHSVDGGYALVYRRSGGGRDTLYARRIVLSLPVEATRGLLEDVCPDGAEALGGIESASAVVLNLGYRREDVEHPLNGFGFLVPRNEPEVPVMGILWADSTFPHVAPAGCRLLRVFLGGARDPDAVKRSDSELLRMAEGPLRKVLGVIGSPMLVDICRHPAAIPQYHCGHASKIARLEAAVGRQPGLSVIGNFLHGISVNDCVRVATQCAERVIEARRHGTVPSAPMAECRELCAFPQ